MVLRWSCRHPALIFLLAGGLLAGSLHLFYDRVSIGQFFNWQPRQELRINVTMPPGSEIERTAALMTAFEEDALAAPGKKSVLVEYGANSGFLRVTFPPEVQALSSPWSCAQNWSAGPPSTPAPAS